MNQTTKTAHTKGLVYELHGFTITPTYESNTGNLRVCASIQGWHIHRTDGMWRDGRRSWRQSKAEAIRDIKQWHQWAHSGPDEELLVRSRSFLEWLAKIWPEASAVKRGIAIHVEREKEQQRLAELESQQHERARLLNAAAPLLLEACIGMLRDYEDEFGEGECDCRPEPENEGHVCNACLARHAIKQATTGIQHEKAAD